MGLSESQEAPFSHKSKNLFFFPEFLYIYISKVFAAKFSNIYFLISGKKQIVNFLWEYDLFQ